MPFLRRPTRCSRSAATAMKTQQIHQALNAVWTVVADANRYFAAAAPWALRKTDPTRMEAVLYVTAEVIRQVAILAQPAMPNGREQAARPAGGAGGCTHLRRPGQNRAA